MDIIIGKGLNIISFDSTINDAEKILGKPDKSYADEYGDLHVLYFERGLILKFEKFNNMNLHWIEIHNKEISFDFLPKTWQLKKDDLIKIILEKYDSRYLIDDYGSMESIYFDDIALELQFELGKLDCINVGSF